MCDKMRWAPALCALLAGCAAGSGDRVEDWPAAITAPPSALHAGAQQGVEVPPVNWDDGLSLDEALELALAQNPRLRAVRWGLPGAQGRQVAAGQWPFNPVLESSAAGAFPLGREDRSFGVGLSQRFEIGGQRGRRVEVAEAGVAQSAAAIADAERLVRADVTSAFYEALYFSERLALGERNLAVADDILAAAQARFDAQQIAEVELNLLRLDRERAEVELLGLRTGSSRALASLAALLGEPGVRDLRVVGVLTPAAGLTEVERTRALELAIERRPDLAAVRHAIRGAHAQVELERSRRWPDVELGLAYQRTLEDLGGVSDRDHSLGLELRLPLPFLNRREGEILVARAGAEQLEAQLEAAVRQAELELDLALQRRALAIRTLDAYATRLASLSRRNLEEIERAYRAGEVDTLAVLRAREDFNRVAAGQLEALLEYHRARIALEAAVGGPLP